MENKNNVTVNELLHKVKETEKLNKLSKILRQPIKNIRSTRRNKKTSR